MTIGKTKVYTGTLSNIERRADGELDLLIADLTETVRGQVIVTTVVAADAHADAVRDLFVEGASVRLYGVPSKAELAPGENPNRFVVIGPDLTRRTLAKQAEREARTAQAQASITKRPLSPAARASWERFRKRHRAPAVSAA